MHVGYQTNGFAGHGSLDVRRVLDTVFLPTRNLRSPPADKFIVDLSAMACETCGLAGRAFKNGGYRHHSALESRLHALINDPDDDDDDDVISILREEFDLECSPRSELGIDAPDQRYPPTSCRVSSCNVIGELFDHSHVGGDNPSHEIADRYHADNSFSFKYG